MIQTTKQGRRAALVAILACLPMVAEAATAVSDTFDTDIGTWEANTNETTVSHAAVGGNPGGFMSTTTEGNALGAMNLASDYTGVFTDGLWTVSVDLAFLSGTFNDARLRFRYQDPTASGWHYSLEKSNFLASWQNYEVTFDTTWSDQEAQANGWKAETGAPKFMDLWDDVSASEIRLVAGPFAIAGIDNYNAALVPIPAAVWLFGSGLLGLIGFARRSKTRS